MNANGIPRDYPVNILPKVSKPESAKETILGMCGTCEARFAYNNSSHCPICKGNYIYWYKENQNDTIS